LDEQLQEAHPDPSLDSSITMKWIISGSKGRKYSGSEKDGGFCGVVARLCFILSVTGNALKIL
jgi:hypothetical protein